MIAYYKGEAHEIQDDARLYRHEASPKTGCGKAGRKHELYRQDCYLTYCIHEDCDFQI